MQVSAGQDGIQRLLAAEQEAQKIVAKARKGIGRPPVDLLWLLNGRADLCPTADKQERLKQAKREAEKEIQSYKQQREDTYQKRIKDVRLQPSQFAVFQKMLPGSGHISADEVLMVSSANCRTAVVQVTMPSDWIKTQRPR